MSKKPNLYLGKLVLKKGDKPTVIAVSWWSKKRNKRLRFHSPCLAKGGAKMTKEYEVSSAMRLIYKDSLEAQNETCVVCGAKLQVTIVVVGPSAPKGGKLIVP